MDVIFFVNGIPKQEEHPTIQITGPQTVSVVWNFNKKLLGINLPNAISMAMNFSTESARYNAYNSIGQEVSTSPVARSTLGNYLPSPLQFVQLPMQIKKNQPALRHFSYSTGVKYDKYKQYNTLFIATLTVDKEWQDLNAESKAGKTVDFGFSQSSAEESPLNKKGGGGGRGR